MNQIKTGAAWASQLAIVGAFGFGVWAMTVAVWPNCPLADFYPW